MGLKLKRDSERDAALVDNKENKQVRTGHPKGGDTFFRGKSELDKTKHSSFNTFRYSEFH